MGKARERKEREEREGGQNWRGRETGKEGGRARGKGGRWASRERQGPKGHRHREVCFPVCALLSAFFSRAFR